MAIDSYSFGKIQVNGKIYSSDLIIYPNNIDSPWWRKEGHQLQMEDLTQILERKPDLLIIGTGYMGVMRVSKKLKDQIMALGVNLYVARTQKAIDHYNSLRNKDKTIVAALHLTC